MLPEESSVVVIKVLLPEPRELTIFLEAITFPFKSYVIINPSFTVGEEEEFVRENLLITRSFSSYTFKVGEVKLPETYRQLFVESAIILTTLSFVVPPIFLAQPGVPDKPSYLTT